MTTDENETVLLTALREILDGSDHDGIWCDEDGNECEEGDEGARWRDFDEEEQANWIVSVAQIARDAIAKYCPASDD